jgi:hypothetical protein
MGTYLPYYGRRYAVWGDLLAMTRTMGGGHTDFQQVSPPPPITARPWEGLSLVLARLWVGGAYIISWRMGRGGLSYAMGGGGVGLTFAHMGGTKTRRGWAAHGGAYLKMQPPPYIHLMGGLLNSQHGGLTVSYGGAGLVHETYRGLTVAYGWLGLLLLSGGWDSSKSAYALSMQPTRVHLKWEWYASHAGPSLSQQLPMDAPALETYWAYNGGS